MNSRNWAHEEARRIINSEGFRDTPADVIAAALQGVADECEKTLWERVQSEEYGHAKAAVTLDIEAIRARFPRCADAE